MQAKYAGLGIVENFDVTAFDLRISETPVFKNFATARISTQRQRWLLGVITEQFVS